MESGVDFVCCDNPHANRLMLRMLAAFAEHEREMISERVRAALGRVKEELKHGPRVSQSGRLYIKLGGPKLSEARAKALALRLMLRPAESTLDLMCDLRLAGQSYDAIASDLNERNIRTSQGFRWYGSTVRAALARTQDLNRLQITATPSFLGSNAGREPRKAGVPMPSDIKEAERMIDLFTSVGARSFVVTKTDINQSLIWGKTYSAVELRNFLPAMVRTAASRKPITLEGGGIANAGENLIVRPTGAETVFVQLDDLSAEQLDRLRPAAFLIIATSPGNHQSWIAVSGVDKGESKEFIRRVREAVGGADKAASGATRLAGTENFKRKYGPDYPTVTIIHGLPGRVMTPERLQEMGLLAEAKPIQVSALKTKAPHRVSACDRPWPSYQITLSRARPKKDGSGPDRSLADFNWSLTAITGGKSVEDTAARLLEVSQNAQERYSRGDEGYTRVTVENAAAAVARNYGRSRA